MITTMPDKSVRVTSRFPNGRSTVYFDLERARGFTLEQDQYRSEVSVLRMMGGYIDCAARYGDVGEAEADFADLTTMLGDRHCHLSLPAPASLIAPPSVPSGRSRRLALTGMIAGLALGIVGASVASNWHWGDTSRVSLAVPADPLSRLAESALGSVRPSTTPLPVPMSALERMAWEQAHRQEQLEQKQKPSVPAPVASFGLQQ